MTLNRTQLADILWAISEAREYLDGHMDVDEGRPNKAMQICNWLDEAHTHVERAFDATSPDASQKSFEQSSFHS